MIEFKHRGGGVKSSSSKGLQNLDSLAAKKLCSLEDFAFPSTNGRGLKISLSKAKVRFSGEGSDLSDSVKSLVSTAEKTAGLPRSQGYLLPRNDMMKKVAFTLAEVLITLGIIGVVAALTLPSLIQNYQKQVYVNQLKKSYSTLSNGFRLMLATDDVEYMGHTKAFKSIYPFGCSSLMYSFGNPSDCNDFFAELKKYFNIIDIRQLTASDNYHIKCLNENCGSSAKEGGAIFLADGTMIYDFQFLGGANGYAGGMDSQVGGSIAGKFYIDVNGLKNPNTYGRDIFHFDIGNSGILVPMGSMMYCTDASCHWRTTTNNMYNCDPSVSSIGWGCAARVLEEGKMDY